MRPCVPCTRGTAWSGECPPCSSGKAWRPERPLWSPGCSRPHWPLSWEQWGAVGRDRWGPGFPFRLQLPFLVQETLLSARLGCCSQGHGSQGWKPSVPDGRGESTFVLPVVSVPQPPLQSLVFLGPGLSVSSPYPPRPSPDAGPHSAHSRAGSVPRVPPPALGGDSGPVLHLGRCVQAPAWRVRLPSAVNSLGACCPLFSWSPQVHFCILFLAPPHPERDLW